jgi:hypothetical protein
VAKDERPRDAQGKFVEKPKEPAAPAEARQSGQACRTAAAAPAPADPEAPLVTTTGQPIDINRPPSSWKPAAKAAWMTLPPEIRTEIHRRERLPARRQDAAGDADFGRRSSGVVEPYRMLIESEGGTPEKAIADLMRTAALFRTGQPQQKLQALFGIAQQFNVPLAEYMQAEFAKAKGDPNAPAAQAQPQSFQDPRVDQLLAAQQRQERERVAHEERVSNAATERFLSAKDDKGQPLYPFVDNVLEDMSERVSSMRRTNPAIGHEEALKQAYEAAVWANPKRAPFSSANSKPKPSSPQKPSGKLNRPSVRARETCRDAARCPPRSP